MKKKIIIIIALVAVIATIIALNLNKGVITAFSSKKGLEVKTANALLSDVKAIVSVNGVIEEVNKQEVYIDGSYKVKNLYVSKDQYVKKGQKLFELDLDDIYSQLNQSKVNLNIQNLNLKKIEDSLKTQNVKQLEASLAQVETNLEQAKSNYQRNQKLYKEGVISSVELESYEIQYNNSKQQYDIAKSNLEDLIKTNNDLESNNSIDVKNQMEQIKLTQIAIDDMQKRIDKINSQSISPIEGVITELNLEKGSITTPGLVAIKIIDPNKLRVKAEVSEIDILNIKVGQKVEVTGDAFQGIIINGELSTISSVAKKKEMSNSDNTFVEVLMDVNDENKILKPGLSVNADINTVSKQGVVVVPFDTIQEDKDGNTCVYVVEDNIVRKVFVNTGINSGLNIEILNDLTGEEVLVKNPPSRLQDGDLIIVKN